MAVRTPHRTAPEPHRWGTGAEVRPISHRPVRIVVGWWGGGGGGTKWLNNEFGYLFMLNICACMFPLSQPAADLLSIFSGMSLGGRKKKSTQKLFFNILTNKFHIHNEF